uniref:Uncharacterized protein n=1 Tax=Oryza rufipogon TaxID=4529 RepID=A0A0E0PHF8_ORYRU
MASISSHHAIALSRIDLLPTAHAHSSFPTPRSLAFPFSLCRLLFLTQRSPPPSPILRRAVAPTPPPNPNRHRQGH